MEHQTIAAVVRRISNGDFSYFETMAPEERKYIEAVMREYRRDGRSRTLEALYQLDFEDPPVSIDQFLDDDYYLGKVGSSLFPLWRREMRIAHDPKNEIVEWVLRGAIGLGKTTIAVISMLYKIHILCCMKDPQKYYRLTEGSPIVFGLFNIFKYLAQDTSYKYFTNWTKLSPFFQEKMRQAYSQERSVPGWLQRLNRMYGIKNDDLANSYVQFPKNITIAVGSQAIHALGQNLFGGILDEADMGRIKSASDQDKSQIADLYGQARSRMDSRFEQLGGTNPGMLVLCSQVRDRESFLEKHVAKVKHSPHTHVSAFSLWEMKPHVYEPNQPTFRVVVGNRRTRSFIVRTNDEGHPTKRIPDDCQVVEVPEQLRARFEYSLDDAIRDLAGIPTFGQDLFLARRDKLFACYKRCQRLHPFSCDMVELSIENDDSTTIVDAFRKELCMFQHDKVTGAWKPRWYAGVPRAVHVDLSKNKDYAGIAMGCIGDVRSVQRFDNDGRPYRTQDYSIHIDFALRIGCVHGSEIDFSKIRQFVFYLSDIGFPIKWWSYDGWQSVDSLQQAKKAGYEAKVLSVDKKPDQYNYLRSTIYEERFDMYDYEPLTQELTQLRDYSLVKGAKPPIDHPPRGSKDVSDGVCGVTARLVEERGLLRPSPTDKDISLRERAHQQIRRDPAAAIRDQSWIAKRPEQKNPLATLFDEGK